MSRFNKLENWYPIKNRTSQYKMGTLLWGKDRHERGIPYTVTRGSGNLFMIVAKALNNWYEIAVIYHENKSNIGKEFTVDLEFFEETGMNQILERFNIGASQHILATITLIKDRWGIKRI